MSYPDYPQHPPRQPQPARPYQTYAPQGNADALYGATLPQAFKRFFQRYAHFRGHASRSEFWWVYLITFSVGLIFGLAMEILEITSVRGDLGMSVAALIVSTVYLLVVLALLVPSIAITVRRLRDSGLSGWLYFLTFIPFAGQIALIFLTIMPIQVNQSQFVNTRQ